ncbi:MAG TPA: alpha/beta hydrolase [Terriglobales bacterium]|nr:alpha/beta hydrolase [Terriglobales bacterium]HET7871657.1 alpha/beta hydrolase [Terriglobales bacterium]
MIWFSKSITVALNLLRNVMGISIISILFLFGVHGSCSGQSAPSVASEVADFQKLEPALKFLRARNARTYAITAPNGIDEATYVKIGGIEQWITIRGQDRNNPVLLFLHGGPGDATNPWGYAGFRNWLKYFTVVQWDQRGAGRTFGRNRASSASTITPDRMVQDGIELSELLKKTLHKNKILLVGHSWGSVLGFFMVKARPDLFYAFVGTGQVAAEFSRSSSVAYTTVLERASRQGNLQAVQELKEIGPPPYKDGKGFGVVHKWAMLFERADVFLASALGFALTAPGYSVGDINDWFDGQSVSGEHLAPFFDELDRKLLGGELAVPVFVIQGAEDYTTPVSLAKAYLDSLRAPHKAFATIEGAGHFAVFTNQDEFLKYLRAQVLPFIH